MCVEANAAQMPLPEGMKKTIFLAQMEGIREPNHPLNAFVNNIAMNAKSFPKVEDVQQQFLLLTLPTVSKSGKLNRTNTDIDTNTVIDTTVYKTCNNYRMDENEAINDVITPFDEIFDPESVPWESGEAFVETDSERNDNLNLFNFSNPTEFEFQVFDKTPCNDNNTSSSTVINVSVHELLGHEQKTKTNENISGKVNRSDKTNLGDEKKNSFGKRPATSFNNNHSGNSAQLKKPRNGNSQRTMTFSPGFWR